MKGPLLGLPFRSFFSACINNLFLCIGCGGIKVTTIHLGSGMPVKYYLVYEVESFGLLVPILALGQLHPIAWFMLQMFLYSKILTHSYFRPTGMLIFFFFNYFYNSVKIGDQTSKKRCC